MPAAAWSEDRMQTAGEEIANSVSYGVALLAAALAMPVLVADAARRGDPVLVLGASVFCGSVLLLYLASTLYHAPPGRAKPVLRILDHGAIYLLIAGTYTPFALGPLRGPWGFGLLGAIWTLAATGIALKAIGGLRHPALSTTSYLGMGWLVVVAAKPLWLSLTTEGLVWLLSGGISYTAGVAFFAAPRLRCGHFVWHLFVIAGSTCHFLAVLRHAT
jgi:hemolysin III